MAEVTQYYPTAFTDEDLAEATTTGQLIESLVAEAHRLLPAAATRSARGARTEARQIEREVMLQIIDQRWREHLSEMDYLREGINLRAMGQQDPLVAWQREGFEMFGQLMDAIDDDYLRYVLHVQVIAEPGAEPDLDQASLRRRPTTRWPGPSLLDAVRAAAPGPRRPWPPEPAVPVAGAGPAAGSPTGPRPRPGTGARWRRDPAAGGEGAQREAGPQRTVLVRERQEVQALPWRRLRPAGAGDQPRPRRPS